MSVVEQLKHLSEELADGKLSREDFERERARLLNSVETAEEAPPPMPAARVAAQKPDSSGVEPGVTLILVALGSILPGLVAMLAFNLPLWSGATIFVACLGGLTWLWARSLREVAEVQDG